MDEGEDGVGQVAEEVWRHSIRAWGFAPHGSGQDSELIFGGRFWVGMWGALGDVVKEFGVKPPGGLQNSLNGSAGWG